MNIEEIRSLAEIMSANGLTYLKVNEGDLHIQLEKQVYTSMPIPSELPGIPAAIQASVSSNAVPSDTPVNFNNLKEQKSPMVGMFYNSPSPEAEPFVKIGSKVKTGDVLCIIEAMKLLNEITAETEGEIVDVCVNNGDLVEFGQVLYKIF